MISAVSFHCPECRHLTATPAEDVRVLQGKPPHIELACSCCRARAVVEVIPELGLMLLIAGAEAVYPITNDEVERFADALASTDFVADHAT